MKGFYINLDTRTDRKNHIENSIKKLPFFENIERFSAIKNLRGDIGCSMSHIRCLSMLLEKDEEYYMIIEDDFCILEKSYFDSFVKDFNNIKDSNDWDIITLTPRGNTKIKNYLSDFHRIEENQTATGYIIKHKFIKTLLEVYKEGILGLMNNKDPNKYALDQCWKPLQEKSNFIYYKNIFGGQLPGYSDIEKRNVNYNQRFVMQNAF